MIPSTTNQLLVAEDWKKIYQSFQNAEFQSYDFDTLRRTMITYLRENFPEDFNDYIDSSEYIALVDLIAFLGQNLSFRIDLNARENFLETAERRDSILRLAQLISYNPKRNVPANGLLKITSISTTGNVYDVNGTNLSNVIVGWDDPTNSNWYQQFITILNSAMVSPTQFGKPVISSVINGISTEQYKINSNNADVPVFSFTKSIAGTTLSFELVSSTFANNNYIYEETPQLGNSLGIIFQNDNQGSGSANTGFFIHFREGTLSNASFSVSSPVPNELVGINVNNINDTDVWLWQKSLDGTTLQTLWQQVPALTGNNVIYNSLNSGQRNIYAVLTRDNDQIDLSFADGSFGNLPNGSFALYYRQSSGLTYSIKPEQLSNVSVQIPFTDSSGQSQLLTLILSLQYTVSNASGSESSDDIKLKAPQTYYTQNRMITAEDYNIAPLNVSPDIIKLKSINRVSSGISKYYELSDVSGAYSSTDIFATDGILYKEYNEGNFQFSFTTRNEIFSVLQTQLSTVIGSAGLNSFYLDQYPRVDLSYANLAWNQSNLLTNQTNGYFNSYTGPVSVGYLGTGNLSYISAGSLIKFVPPANNYFLPKGQLTNISDDTTKSYIWAQVVNIIGDGSNNGTGNLVTGVGPITMTGSIFGNGQVINNGSLQSPSLSIPSSAIPQTIIPKFINILSYDIQTEIANLSLSKRNFGLSFDATTRTWYIIVDTNLDLLNSFSLSHQKDISNSNLDASWMVAFQWTGKEYNVRYRTLDYVFESAAQTAFFVDTSTKNYDFTNDTVVKDRIDVLSINKGPTPDTISLGYDYSWQINSAVIESDGYVEPKKVLISFYDRNDNGQIDDPDTFNNIVSPDSNSLQTGYKDKFIYFLKSATGSTYSLYNGSIIAYPNQNAVVNPIDGQKYYFYDIDLIKIYSSSTNSYDTPSPYLYFARSGRKNIKFHYIHNAANERRLDPSKMNIIDVYLLSSSYDSEYRSWLMSGTGTAPITPTSQSLENNYSSYLEPIKSISDEIVYHPAIYKVLFGGPAPTSLQATFKAVQSPTSTLSATSLQSSILTAINNFFAIENWDFGQTFNFGELVTYVMNIMTPDITNFVIVPKSTNNSFGSLFQITCQSNEIFISGATVSDIQILSSLTASELNATSIVSSS